MRDGGADPSVQSGDVMQAIRKRSVQSFLWLVGDPDFKICDTYAKGVPIGYAMKLPRTPAIFERKTKWSVLIERGEVGDYAWGKNYKYAEEHNKVLK